MDELLELIHGWTSRVRLQKGLHWLFLGLACGLAIALIITFAARLFPILSTPALVVVSVGCALSSALAAFSMPWIITARTSSIKWAREFDQQFYLKERLSTALELREGIVTTQYEPLRRLQQEDAAQAALKLDINELVPLQLPTRYVLLAIAIALVLAAITALPNPQQQVLANRAQIQKVIDKQIQQLESAKQLVQQSQSLTDAQKTQIEQALNNAQKTLGEPDTSPEKALAAIHDAQSKLDNLSDPSTQNQVSDLQRAGQSLAPDQLTNPLANALENGNPAQAASQLRDLPQNNGQPLTNSQRQRLANQLDQIAQNIQNSNKVAASQLQQAAQQMRDMQDAAAQKSLNQIADELNQLAQKQTSQQQLTNTQASLENTLQSITEADQNAKAQSERLAQDSASQQSMSGQNGTAGQQDLQNQSGTSQGLQGQKVQPGNQQINANGGQAAQANQQSNNASAQQSGAVQNSNSMATSSQHHEDVGSDSSVMAPQRINNAGQNVVLPDDTGQNVTNVNAPTNPGISNQATVPYQQVYAQYARTADEALQNGQIPAALQDYVRNYFSSLDPQHGQ